ncbi:MAG: hypothetical protein AXW12_02030 [Thalassospira sp. Nap_22]|nr:MAG: hypothetical protein AXW12_02030 [Thalassospira sp. Nap_22]
MLLINMRCLAAGLLNKIDLREGDFGFGHKKTQPDVEPVALRAVDIRVPVGVPESVSDQLVVRSIRSDAQR